MPGARAQRQPLRFSDLAPCLRWSGRRRLAHSWLQFLFYYSWKGWSSVSYGRGREGEGVYYRVQVPHVRLSTDE